MIARRTLASLVLLGLTGTAGRAWAQWPDILILREELMALEKESWEALKVRDRAAMRRFLPDDALLIFSDGARYDKREMLDYMADYRLDSYDIDPQYAVRLVTPDVATLIYRVTSRGAARLDRTETSRVLATSLYARRGGRWWSVLYQETALPER
jgi:hypothetical protein